MEETIRSRRRLLAEAKSDPAWAQTFQGSSQCPQQSPAGMNRAQRVLSHTVVSDSLQHHGL